MSARRIAAVAGAGNPNPQSPCKSNSPFCHVYSRREHIAWQPPYARTLPWVQTGGALGCKVSLAFTVNKAFTFSFPHHKLASQLHWHTHFTHYTHFQWHVKHTASFIPV